MAVSTSPSDRCFVVYHFTGNESLARAKAETLCLDQTVELAADVAGSIADADRTVGHVETFQEMQPELFEARISYATEILGKSCAEFLNVVYGISSLKNGIRVAHLDLSDEFLRSWAGPAYGRVGLRALLKVSDRPLICGVLKPLGASPSDLASLAYRFALGGLDLVKDDQALATHAFCPFNERVVRCADAVARANRETGGTTVYAAHVTGGPAEIQRQSRQAKAAGAGALLLCPGLTGFDVLRELAGDSHIRLPLLSHPAMLGAALPRTDSGIAPAVLFGQLPRLAGADVSIAPTFGGPYPITQDDCLRICEATADPWCEVRSIFPAAAGRVTIDRLRELTSTYGRDVIYVLGSELYRKNCDVEATCREVMRAVT